MRGESQRFQQHWFIDKALDPALLFPIAHHVALAGLEAVVLHSSAKFTVRIGVEIVTLVEADIFTFLCLHLCDEDAVQRARSGTGICGPGPWCATKRSWSGAK